MVAVAFHQMGDYRMLMSQDPMPDFEAALKGFEQAQKESPDSMEHFNRIGRVKTSMAEYLMNKGQDPGQLIKEAISDFEKVIARYPRYPDPHCYLAHALNIQVAFEISRNTNPEGFIKKAILYANKSIELDPHDAEAHLELGHAFMLKGKVNLAKDAALNWIVALKALDKAVQENPRLVNGYLKAAETHLLLAEITTRNKAKAEQEFCKHKFY